MARAMADDDGSRSDSRTEASRNGLLATMQPSDLALLEPHLEKVAFGPGSVVFEPGDEVMHAWFPTGAVVSLMIAMADGRAAEAATVGREGALGLMGGDVQRPAFTRGLVQMPGPALRLRLDRLEEARRRSAALGDLLNRYADVLFAQVLQSVGCNILHALDQRCARWLLLSMDRLGLDPEDAAVPLTQERLAMMLGVHRVSVAEVLADLEAAGLVRRSRGRIRVTDRPGLLRRSCECYGVVRAHYDDMILRRRVAR